MPVKDSTIVGTLMNQKYGKRAQSMPAWRTRLMTMEEIEGQKSGTKFRRDPTSIWETTDLPPKRHTRRLSSSKAGLSGNSPTFVEIRAPSPTRENQCRDEIVMRLEMGDLNDLWRIYVESSAWHQDDGAKWPLLNLEFVKVRKRIASLLKEKMKNALAADSVADMEEAVRVADGKIQILAVQSNEQFPELDKIFERLDAKQEEQRQEMRGLVQSSQPETSFDAQDQAREALEEALRSESIDEVSVAIKACMERGVDVSAAAKHVKITSKYFKPEGDRAKGLFAEGCFKGEGRQLHLINLGPEMDFNMLERLMTTAGVKTRIYEEPSDFVKGRDPRSKQIKRSGKSVVAGPDEAGLRAEALDSPHLHTVVVISGVEPARLEGDTGTLKTLIQFNKEGGGLGIFGSGNRGGNSTALIRDANLIMMVLGLDKMWGNDSAGRTLGKSAGPGGSGLNGDHPLFSQFPKLHEGYSTTGLDDAFVKQHGYTELIRGSNSRLTSCIREPSRAFNLGGAGPILIHGSPVQLLCSKEAAGSERWALDLMLYLCLRQADVEEEYVP